MATVIMVIRRGSSHQRLSAQLIQTNNSTTTKRSRGFSSETDGDGGGGRLILVRHGESAWNTNDPNLKTTARFTGWTDVALTDKGREGAVQAGRLLEGYRIDVGVTSLLNRAQETLSIMLQEITGETVEIHNRIPILSSWRLNERHYGAIVGLSKKGAENIYGKQVLGSWRHGWDNAPPPIDEYTRKQLEKLPHCQMVTTYRDLDRDVRILEKQGYSWCGSKAQFPLTESLKDCCDRVLPLFERALAPHLRKGETLLVVSHANTSKALLRVLDPQVVTETAFSKLKIPNSTPLVYNFRNSDALDAIPGGLKVIPYQNQQGSELRHELRGQWMDVL